MEYAYENITNPNLPSVETSVANSTMTDKNIDWCRWDEVVSESNVGKLTICFTNTLSTEDKEKLDIIVGNL